MKDLMKIKTPETDPDHDTIGHLFKAWDGNFYFCDSYDPAIGFWMTDLQNPDNRRNVSERAIGRTYHKIYREPSGAFSTLHGFITDQGEVNIIRGWEINQKPPYVDIGAKERTRRKKLFLDSIAKDWNFSDKANGDGELLDFAFEDDTHVYARVQNENCIGLTYFRYSALTDSFQPFWITSMLTFDEWAAIVERNLANQAEVQL